MNDIRNFKEARTNEFTVTRNGWIKPDYELTDGQFLYGRLTFKGSFKRYALINTATELFTIKRTGVFNRTSLLNKNEDETIGNIIPETWKRDINIQMDNGFNAVYAYKKLFSREYTLSHEMYGDILQIERKAFNTKSPFTIKFNNTEQINDLPPITLLALIGVNLILLQQAQAGVAAAS